MGQYHHVVNATANAYLASHVLGCGLKAWEQCAGGVPAALTALLARRPGNMPADLGHHPMTGAWAGHRVLCVGDYAEDRDIPGFEGPPLSKVYTLCGGEPAPTDWSRTRASEEYKKECYARFLKDRRAWRALTKKHAPLDETSYKIRGLVEEALSVRFIGDGWKTGVPVRPYAERGKDGHLHYVLSRTVARDPDHLRYLGRALGIGGWKDDKGIDPKRPPAGMDRWPWDRPPGDLSWHNVTDKRADEGQRRVFANLDRREYFDPMKFGEQPTVAGIMRAADNAGPRFSIDLAVTAKAVKADVRTGSRELGSASGLFAMLLHPERRGGGDIDAESFAEVGRWRNDRLLLTSEFEDRDSEFPGTDRAMADYEDITDKVMKSLATLAAA